MKRAGRRAGAASAFTLVELLVVVGIIGVLIAILLPALGRAQWYARVTQCSANLRSMSTAVATYANSNDGQFPTLDMLATGGNLWDISTTFYDSLRKQGMTHEAFWCPASQDLETSLQSFNRYPTFYIIGYNIWIPRKNGTTADRVIPPPVTGPTQFQFPSPKPTQPIAGPANRIDPLANVNPIITDIVGSGGTPPANADPSLPGNPYAMSNLSNHQLHFRIVSVNAAFADGHVELVPGSAVHPRFFGNWWNWR